MDIRLIIKDGDRRHTLPIADCSRITWTASEPGGEPVDDIERGTVTCFGAYGKVELPSANVITIYRDDEVAKPAKPRRRRSRKTAPETEPEGEGETS